VLKIESLPTRQPAWNEVRLKVEAIGLNRAEVMFRTGTYLETPTFPARIGLEAAGVRFVFEHLERGTLEPKVDRTHTFEKMVEAHRYLESNAQVGKVVVTVSG
jgi:NADPH:quinone reductase-like Zn-dependent oxidoreductase